MPNLQWNEALSVGIAEIDDQHKTLIDIAARLEKSIAAGTANDEIGNILKELTEYSNGHFQTEEALMQKAGYAGMAIHVKQHGQFRNKLIEYLMRMRRGQGVSAYEILYFLKTWVSDHIMTYDKAMAEAILAVVEAQATK